MVKHQKIFFPMCVGFTMFEEGFESDDPRDPGGYTKYGFSTRAHPDLDIRNMTEDEAIMRYRERYWNPCGCYAMHPALALCVFDAAVNMGIVRGLKMRAEVKPISGMKATVNAYCDLRAATYKRFDDFELFGKIWLGRTERCRAIAEVML